MLIDLQIVYLIGEGSFGFRRIGSNTSGLNLAIGILSTLDQSGAVFVEMVDETVLGQASKAFWVLVDVITTFLEQRVC